MNFIGKFRRKRESTENGYVNNNHSHHRDSITNDHIVIPERHVVAKEDFGNQIDDPVHVRKNSQLAYSLHRLLRDSSALSYFIQYLEANDKLNLIKFWMHVEGFKASVPEGNLSAQELSLLDAKNIYDKYIDDESTSSLALPKKIKKLVDEEINKRPISSHCFDDAQEFVKHLFELRYFEEFQASIYYKKHELGVLSQGCSIQDVLKVQTLLQSFLEFIKSKEDHDMVQFLLGCDGLESNWEHMDDGDALDDAMALYDKYFSMQATNMIDLGQAIRGELESMICDESGRPNPKSFHTAKTICLCRLHDKYMANFLRSPAYHGYLAEISAQIENTVELPRADRQRRGLSSSCSDAPSSSNSLTSVFNKHIDNLAQLENKTPVSSPRSTRSTPRTPRSSRLAHVDELGRYHALYDDTHAHSTHGKTPSRLKSTLRKYLDKSSLKEEEIAEEVARSIIVDMQKMVASGEKKC